MSLGGRWLLQDCAPGLEKPAGLAQGQHHLADSAAEAWPVGQLGLGTFATRTLADVLSLQTRDR